MVSSTWLRMLLLLLLASLAAVFTSPFPSKRVTRRSQLPRWASAAPGPNALLQALQRGDEAMALRLLNSSYAIDLLKLRSRRHDCTPLMLAAGASGCPASDTVVNRILSFGAAANVAAKSRSWRTAADYAALHPTCAHWSPRLRALAQLELSSEDGKTTRCPCCGARLKKRPRIASLKERYLRGEHENELLEDFFSPSKVAAKGVHPWETLMRPEFHTFHKSRTFHKELSESLAMMDAIQNVCPEIFTNEDKWHFLDLCCGKSLTCVLMSSRLPRLPIWALDRVSHEGLPHYQEAGFGMVEYIQQDLMDSECISTLQDRYLAQHADDGSMLVVGLHLCGNLSVKTVELFEQMPQIRVCLLVPCCLPHLRDAPNALKHLYRQSVPDDQQYSEWAGYLEARLAAIPNVTVQKSVAVHMKSKKSIVLTAIKS